MEYYGDYLNSRIADLISDLYMDFDFPLYVYDELTIREKIWDVKDAISYKPFQLRYACKANSNATILNLMKQNDVKIDAVSLGEIKRALAAGFDSKDILYTSEDAKPQTMLDVALREIMFNCSSFEHLENLRMLKQELNDMSTDICVRFNLGIGYGHDEKVKTSGLDSKHGFWNGEIFSIKHYIEGLDFKIKGFHTHAGSCFNLEQWEEYIDKALAFSMHFEDLDFINLGGGLPVRYHPNDEEFDIKRFGEILSDKMERFTQIYGKKLRLELEPGRYLVAESGVLLTQVTALKTTPKYNFAIVDTGFNHLLRPCLYGTYHPITIISEYARHKADIVIAGNLCESGDILSMNDKVRKLVQPNVQDFIAIGNVGAYGMAMASNYNSYERPAEVLVGVDEKPYLIKERENIEEIIQKEQKCIPPYLKNEH